jgi:hypothetical protein
MRMTASRIRRRWARWTIVFLIVVNSALWAYSSLRDCAGSWPSAHRRAARPDAASTARLTPRDRSAPAARPFSLPGDYARRERKP